MNSVAVYDAKKSENIAIEAAATTSFACRR